MQDVAFYSLIPLLQEEAARDVHEALFSKIPLQLVDSI